MKTVGIVFYVGFDAHEEGASQDANPYREGGELWEAWAEGWHASASRHIAVQDWWQKPRHLC